MHLETEIEWTQRCTWRPWWSQFGDALGDWDRVNSETHFEAGIEQVSRCTWRPWSCQLEARNRTSLEIHLEAVIERVWRCNWRPWSSEYGDTLGDRDPVRLDEYLEAADGRRTGTQFISWLTRNHGNVTRWLYLWSSYGELAGGGWSVGRYAGSWSYIQGSTRNCENEGTTDNLRCMLYSVLTHDHGMER